MEELGIKKSVTVLSTKVLTPTQKELMLASGIGFVQYDAIHIDRQGFEYQKDLGTFQNIIITSKNAVISIQNSAPAVLGGGFGTQNYFCVGSVTKRLLEENGQKVVETAENALDLANIIVKKYKKERFLFFCGNMRRDELPSILKKNKVHFEEQIVYHTRFHKQKFDRIFDGILFFSPSGVKSYVSENQLNTSVAFCIGKTTAKEAAKYTKDIVVATKATVENVIVQAIKYFKTN